ncbi:MAG: Na/Pi cotransporter family protein [Spirochaetes bacterium]|nr:Na/Pi cotransporter family protein [Spirochaetota bacterium]
MNTAITIFGGLGLFLFGMKIMSESLQRTAGDNMRKVLSKTTDNRFKGVLTGFTITSIIQSSSATTVMVVSFVSAGLLTLQQSIGIILGANIGTTITGWLVALLGFKVKITLFALPAIGIGLFISFINSDKIKGIGDIFVGFGLLFLGLDIMSGAVSSLRGSDLVMNIMSTYKADTVLGTLGTIAVGSLVTMVIQSSSATMAMTMTLTVYGIIDFYTACALILGENIGTTITANLAAISASKTAKRSALVHFIFNLSGVIWVFMIFKSLFIPIVDLVIPGDPFTVTENSKSILGDHLAMFHTLFNVCNTIIFLPFVNILAKIATKLITGDDLDEMPHLKYISSTMVSTPSININQARLEAKRMSEICIEMFLILPEILTNPDKKLGKKVKKIQKFEATLDLLEKEISEFLVKITQEKISIDQSQQISALLHSINEFERIGDHCERLLILIRRKYDKKLEFGDKAIKSIMELTDNISDFLKLLSNNIENPKNILPDAEVYENRINEIRDEMRKNHIKRLNEQKCTVNTGLLFIDMLTSYEKIGDHAFNIAESISGTRYF